jgi:hypothetical protein
MLELKLFNLRGVTLCGKWHPHALTVIVCELINFPPKILRHPINTYFSTLSNLQYRMNTYKEIGN